MIPINNQSFTHATQLPDRVPSRNNARLNADQAAQAKLFQTALKKVDSPVSQNAQTASSSGNFRQDSNKFLHVAFERDFSLPLGVGVGAKALYDLQHNIGTLTAQQVSSLELALRREAQDAIGKPDFDLKLDQFAMASLMRRGFESMSVEDGKPGLSANDIRQAAARDGNPGNLSTRDIKLPSIVDKLNAEVKNALRGRRNIDLRSGVGAKALRDLHNIGSLTRQQTATLRSDLLQGIQQLIKTNPAAVTSTKLDQLSLASLMLNGFERNAAEDGRPGLSADDLQRVAARTGDPNILSGRDT